MIIFTGRFQPFHNGHLYMIEELRSLFPNETICIAVIKDVPIVNKTEFDKKVDCELKKNIFEPETVSEMINLVKTARKWDNVVVSLMPRASESTWKMITELFDCDRTWAFTQNSKTDAWEEEKVKFYQSTGDKVIRIPISKDINGSNIRSALEDKNYDYLKNNVPEEIVDYLKQI